MILSISINAGDGLDEALTEESQSNVQQPLPNSQCITHIPKGVKLQFCKMGSLHRGLLLLLVFVCATASCCRFCTATKRVRLPVVELRTTQMAVQTATPEFETPAFSFCEPKIMYFTQVLDHFNFNTALHPATFQQRYLVCDQFWDGNGPLFFYTGLWCGFL